MDKRGRLDCSKLPSFEVMKRELNEVELQWNSSHELVCCTFHERGGNQKE